MSYYTLLEIMDKYRDIVIAYLALYFPSQIPIPLAVPTFLFDLFYYLSPPTFFTAFPVWLIKKVFPRFWMPRLYYFALALFAGWIYGSYYYETIPKLLNDPKFSLAYDLYGEHSRSMTFMDMVSINIACIFHIALYSAPYGIPLSESVLYMALSFFGVGHSLFMIRIADDGTKAVLPRPKLAAWKLWLVYGLTVFALWLRIVFLYFIEWGNLNIVRNGGGPGLTPGANFAIMAVLWGTLEFVPYFELQRKTFWLAFTDVLLDYAHVGSYFCRQLYLRSVYSDEELNKHGFEFDWRVAKSDKVSAKGSKEPRTPSREQLSRAAKKRD